MPNRTSWFSLSSVKDNQNSSSERELFLEFFWLNLEKYNIEPLHSTKSIDLSREIWNSAAIDVQFFRVSCWKFPLFLNKLDPFLFSLGLMPKRRYRGLRRETARCKIFCAALRADLKIYCRIPVVIPRTRNMIDSYFHFPRGWNTEQSRLSRSSENEGASGEAQRGWKWGSSNGGASGIVWGILSFLQKLIVVANVVGRFWVWAKKISCLASTWTRFFRSEFAAEDFAVLIANCSVLCEFQVLVDILKMEHNPEVLQASCKQRIRACRSRPFPLAARLD